MRNIYIVFMFLLLGQFLKAQNFTDTKGELQISSSGSAIYNLPIATPPSIKNIAPIINLTYSSGVRGGIAGQGWSINSISAISRIATRRDIDGFVDGVDFDDNDKLALDGQRLLIKTGTYWINGSTYETEYKSNTRIELKIEGTATYFIVTTPDGSRSWYGSKGAGSLQNSVSLNSWYIVRYEDVNGNFIDYNYKTVTYSGTNQLYIDNIAFSGNTTAGIAAQNKISFNYKNSKRIERDYLKGVPVYATQILESIKVYANNSIFRTYRLSHTEDKELGYERVEKITEINAQDEESNPVVFTYAPMSTKQIRTEKEYKNDLAFDKTDLAGDFDGDGRLDFVSNGQMYTNLFNGDKGNAPINLPFSSGMFVATTLTDNKINQFQSIIHKNETINSVEFQVYNLVSSNIVQSNEKKTIALDNSIKHIASKDTFRDESYMGYEPQYPVLVNLTQKTSNEYLEGDFNGDGISEVLIKNTVNEVYYNESWGGDILYSYDDSGNRYQIPNSGSIPVISSDYSNFYLLDLNSNTSTNLGEKGFVKIQNSNLLNGDERKIADFNGDGKSDILIINKDKTYKLISFKQLAIAPWVELELIGAGTLDKYSSTKQMLFGDFNGDGKTDIMLPDSEGGENQVQWHIYYSNANPSGGEFFVKESHNIVEYWPNTGKHYDTQVHLSNYYAIDINGDGKSDLVRVWRSYYKPKWTINDHNTKWQVTAFANNIGKVAASGFIQSYDSTVFDSGSPDIPIPITSNYKYNGANTELIVVRGHKNLIEYYQFNKNVNAENRLLSVEEVSGNIKQTIEYKTMEATDGGLGNPASDFYSSANGVSYPNIEIVKNPNSYLVSKLTATINGMSKYQDFRYRGFVSNYNYGTVGFTRTTRSSWYLKDSDPKIWTTQYNDVALRGANTITWSSTIGATVFNATPTGLLSTKTNVFETYTNPDKKVYNVLLNSQTTLDALTGIKAETLFTYDGTVTSIDYFGLETKSVTKQYSGSALQGTTTVDTRYDNNPLGATNTYYIGRPKKTNTSTIIYTGDTRTAEEVYTYTGSNLSRTEKKGTDTYAMIEDLTYDDLGNLLTKTISAPNTANPPVPRKITDVYDSTKRFVVKKTDHQGFVTTFAYNTLGQVKESQDYLGVVSNYTYDNWGKLKNMSIQNAAEASLTTSIDYTKLSNGGYTTTTTNNTDGKVIVQYDVLGRAVITTTKGFAANSTISRQIVYDELGRKTKESEPYFSAPSQWTVYEYDYLMRPIKITAHTGKIQTLSYNDLTTTSSDDGKITTVTVDALGNKTKTTDPGGIVNFIYYANGQLKESDYQGSKVTIAIDGWGNKIAMTDPSAGTYTYSYDAFGQIRTETTPNGTTTYLYDTVGRTTEKTIKGINTDSKTSYVYNAYNLISSSLFIDNLAGSTITNMFGYDSYKRISKTTETSPYTVFTKEFTYDTYGRALGETSTGLVVSSGKSSVKKVKHTYQNGFPWQILDDASQKVLWQANSLNERGQLTGITLGNGIVVSKAYDQYGYVSQFKFDRTVTNPGNVLSLTTVFEPKRGNLTSRANNLFNRNEVFRYDAQDRLKDFNNNGQGATDLHIYDDKGRIKENTLGSYGYNIADKPYQNSSITLSTQGLYYYRNRAVEYNQDFFSDDMESGTGWSLFAQAPQCISFDNTKSYTGNSSLKISTVTVSTSYVMCDSSLRIKNAVPVQYTFSGWVYSDGPTADLTFLGYEEYNTGYNYKISANVSSTVLNKWTYITKTILVPASVTSLRLRVYSSGKGNVWFDDVRINKALLRSGQVRTTDFFSDDMEARSGWSTLPQSLQCISFDNTKAHTGNNSIKINTANVTVSHVMCDNALAINNTASIVYTFSGWVYTDGPSAEVTFFGYTGTNTGYNYEISDRIGATDINKWIYISKSILVPANIKSMRLRVCSTGNGNAWFDDLEISKTPAAAVTANVLNISYNTFKSPVQIEETDIDKISFSYNDSNSRTAMFYGGLQEDQLQRPLRKYYSADGTMEIKENRVTKEVEFITYIGGDGYTAPLAVKSDGIKQDYLYLHRDYQGSILAITDDVGAVLEKRFFDAWGAIVKVQNGAGTDLAGLTVLDRGYTGHEHLQSVGIINMNGRLYDPKLHRFLQPDNFIQDPSNTQNYNRYGYVLNNPLKYTDPSGEIFIGAAIGIGAAIAALTYTITALVADVPFSVGGLAKATFIGAASSAVTFGIGTASGNLFTNFYLKAAFQAAAHGTFQGGMTAISGGKFWSGFAAGALSSVAASAWSGGGSTSSYHGAGNFADSGVGMISFGTVSGGVGAQLTGGNFWQGAVTGLVVSGLNHFAHAIGQKNYKTKLRSYFDNSGIDPDAVPEKSLESVNKLKIGLKQLAKLFSKNGNPTISVGNSDYGERGQVATAYRDNTMTIWGFAFESNYNLAFTMFHEGTHSYFNLIGLSAKWNKDYFDCGSDVNEYNAYRLGLEIAPDIISSGLFKYLDSMNGNYYGSENMNHWEQAYNLFNN